MCPICQNLRGIHDRYCPNGMTNALSWGVTAPESDAAAYRTYWATRS